METFFADCNAHNTFCLLIGYRLILLLDYWPRYAQHNYSLQSAIYTVLNVWSNTVFLKKEVATELVTASTIIEDCRPGGESGRLWFKSWRNSLLLL